VHGAAAHARDAASLQLRVMTILGLGIGPYVVGLLSDATGDLRWSMLGVNAVGIPIVILLLIAKRAQRDEDALIEHAPRLSTKS